MPEVIWLSLAELTQTQVLRRITRQKKKKESLSKLLSTDHILGVGHSDLNTPIQAKLQVLWVRKPLVKILEMESRLCGWLHMSDNVSKQVLILASLPQCCVCISFSLVSLIIYPLNINFISVGMEHVV